jgi:hypothetical protein
VVDENGNVLAKNENSASEHKLRVMKSPPKKHREPVPPINIPKKNEPAPLGEHRPYFGVPLQEIVDREGGKIPLLVHRAIEYLEKNCKIH